MLKTKVDKEHIFHTRYVATECVPSNAQNCLQFDNTLNLIVVLSMRAMYSSDIWADQCLV
jgi:hypothetical protein